MREVPPHHRRLGRLASMLAIALCLVEGTGALAETAVENLASLSAADLIGLTVSVRSFRPRDAFDAPTPVRLAARRFSIVLPVGPAVGEGCTSLPFWRYNAAGRKLQMTFFGDRRSGFFLKGRNGKVHPILSDAGSFMTAPVTCSRADKGSYRASNAFGATTTIFRKAETVVEVAAVLPPDSPARSDFLMSELTIEPEEARLVTPKLQVRYEGYLGDWGNGSSVVCGVERLPPDMQSVWDTTVDTCIYHAVIEHVAFVDGRTGRVLVEKRLDKGSSR